MPYTHREDLASFVTALSESIARSSRPLDEYLEALARWVSDADGWYANFGQVLPVDGDWKFFARALTVVYE